jgi:hypothetical protein
LLRKTAAIFDLKNDLAGRSSHCAEYTGEFASALIFLGNCMAKSNELIEEFAATDEMLIDPAERRTTKRKTLLTHADIELSESEILSGHAVDISLGGAGLISPVTLKVGQEVAIGLSLSACGMDHRISLSGRVAYCVKVGLDRFRVGLQWIHLDDSTEAFINAVCA